MHSVMLEESLTLSLQLLSSWRFMESSFSRCFSRKFTSRVKKLAPLAFLPFSGRSSSMFSPLWGANLDGTSAKSEKSWDKQSKTRWMWSTCRGGSISLKSQWRCCLTGTTSRDCTFCIDWPKNRLTINSKSTDSGTDWLAISGWGTKREMVKMVKMQVKVKAKKEDQEKFYWRRGRIK